MTTLTNTGVFLNAKFKQRFEKDGVDRTGRPVRRVSLRVVYFPKGPQEEETRSTFISVPLGYQLPDLEVDRTYTFPVDVSGGKDRNVFFNLNTHVAIQADE